MVRIMRLQFFFVLLVFLCVSCASSQLRKISADASKVQFQNQKSNLLGSCKRLERMEASARYDVVDSKKTAHDVEEDTKNKLREQAVLMGADTVVITNDDGFYPYEYKAQAIGFKCFEN
jgi:hypothetical protein